MDGESPSITWIGFLPAKLELTLLVRDETGMMYFEPFVTDHLPKDSKKTASVPVKDRLGLRITLVWEWLGRRERDRGRE